MIHTDTLLSSHLPIIHTHVLYIYMCVCVCVHVYPCNVELILSISFPDNT